ncbi:MAG: hypothetical protein A2413_07160 [Treponema sp. RIFOXYC1_FULL_61_9]|nr:MAG: hypothetical protein A2413_07160 [Treponema sp. RIFOXYC1_FULL_61_9]
MSVLLCALSLCSASAAFAQEAPAPIPAPTPVPAPTPAAEAEPVQVSPMELDIRTSTLLELAAWCRELGLSEGGTKNELAGRLRKHFRLPEPAASPATAASEGSARTVVVESARSTEYFTLEAVDEEYARLRGDVVVTMKDGESTHRIRAKELLYNRSRNLLTATGNVEYEKTGGETTETFIGDSITVEMDNWTGVFLGGASELSKKSDATAYRFSASMISRAAEDVTVLTDATVKTASAEEPYWSLSASKIWLLPGSEWAILNAVLKIGEVPMLYIPFFYLPGDELVFHPVLGYRSREGSFVQTTTYLIGRPKAAASGQSSIMKVLAKDENEERKLEGIFLRGTGKRTTADTGASLSLLFDAYANLGYHLGVNAAFPKKGILGKTDLSVGLGVTRNVMQLASGDYSPFDPETGESVWNEARLFSAPVPFRYRMKAAGSLALGKSNLTWSFPFYSDPFVDQDFLNRSENMDWFNMMKDPSAGASATTTIAALGSYEWRVSSSNLFGDLKALSPFVKTASISSMYSALTFSTRTDSEQDSSSPSRTFFYPNKLTLLSASASVAGVPFSLGSGAAAEKPAAAKKEIAESEKPTAMPGEARSPWTKDETAATTDETATADDGLRPPAIVRRSPTPAGAGDPGFEISYSLSPSASSDLVFNSNSSTHYWKNMMDVAWDDHSSLLSATKLTGSLSAKASSAMNLASLAVTLSGNGAWQEYSYMNEDATEFDTPTKRLAADLRNYKSTFFTTSADAGLTIKPFPSVSALSASSFKYSVKGLVAKSVFEGDAADPSYSVEYGAWEKDSLTSHQISASLAASVREQSQTLTLSADLPPLDSSASAAASLKIWRTTTSGSGKVTDLDSNPQFQPVTLTESVDLGTGRSASSSFTYNPELEDFTSAVASLNLGAFTASLNAARANRYDLIESQGWVLVQDTEALRAKTLSMNYKLKGDSNLDDKGRFKVSLDSSASVAFDFLRFTQSSFNSSITAGCKINDFLDLSITTRSQNAVIFRYLQDIHGLELPVEIPGEKNPLIDLANSFAFFDDELRKSSGFKLKSFDLAATHYLGDWNAKLNFSLKPFLDMQYKKNGVTVPTYRFLDEISFLVQWVPITEFKTEIKKDKDGFVYK